MISVGIKTVFVAAAAASVVMVVVVEVEVEAPTDDTVFSGSIFMFLPYYEDDLEMAREADDTDYEILWRKRSSWPFLLVVLRT